MKKFCNEIRILENSNNEYNKYSTVKNTRYGVDLTNLPLEFSNLLNNRPFTRHLTKDPQLLKIAVYCSIIESDHLSYDKVFYIKHLNKIVSKNKIKYFNSVFRWKCSFCGKRIYIDISQKVRHRYLQCSDCLKKMPIVDQKIVDNHIKLNKFIIDKMKKDHLYITKKIKKNQL